MLKRVLMVTIGLIIGCSNGVNPSSVTTTAQVLEPDPDASGTISFHVEKGDAVHLAATKLLTGNNSTRYFAVDIPKNALTAATDIQIFETESLTKYFSASTFEAESINEAGPAIVISGDSSAIGSPITVYVPVSQTMLSAIAIIIVNGNTAQFIDSADLIGINGSNGQLQAIGIPTSTFGVFQAFFYSTSGGDRSKGSGFGHPVLTSVPVSDLEFKPISETAAANAPMTTARASASTESIGSSSDLLTCDGSGLFDTVPGGSDANGEYKMSDNGRSAGGDSLEIYCQDGKSRFCLSGEQCPWRNNGTSTDEVTCSTAGLSQSDMATVTDWKGLSFVVNCQDGVVSINAPESRDSSGNVMSSSTSDGNSSYDPSSSGSFGSWQSDCLNKTTMNLVFMDGRVMNKEIHTYADTECSQEISFETAAYLVTISSPSDETYPINLVPLETLSSITYDIMVVNQTSLCFGLKDSSHQGISEQTRPVQADSYCYNRQQ